MIISELRLFNFRKFNCVDDVPGLVVTFHKGLNALIGENDSGKTAIIDAIKLVLLTQSNEYVKPTDDDFMLVQMAFQSLNSELIVYFQILHRTKQKTLLNT